jgi:uncharacterized protein YfaS (alpha-2-macroglobulin family)
MILLLTVLAASCKKETARDETLSYPLETAKLISQVTSGVISPDGAVVVRFVSPVIKENLVGESITKEVFNFEPSITGVSRWQDRQTLVFKPNAPLPLREKYEGSLDLGTLLPLHKDLEPLKFRFEVAGREIATVQTDFELINDNDPQNLRVAGSVSFSETADIEAVEEATTLHQNGKKLKLNWSVDESNTTFAFSSESIRRGDKELKFALKIEKSPLEISEDFRKDFSLSPLNDLSVLDISKQEDGDRPGIIIEFSDELDIRTDLTGLISTDPQKEIKLKAIGKKVFVSGDFQYGEEYTLNISEGIRSRWGTTLGKAAEEKVSFSELKPQMKFASDGVFLPTANERKVRFMAVNLQQVRVEIKKVFENNLGYFLQDQQLNSSQTRNEQFGNYSVNRVGVSVYKDSLDLGIERNVWKQHEMDLSKLIPANERGLYIISITFQHRDMLYGDPSEVMEQRGRRYYGNDYYSNPYSQGYLYSHGRIYKPIIVSDIGVTYKKAYKQHLIYTTFIANAKPLSGVNISLRTYQNQLIASKITDSEGFADFNNIEQDVFYVEAEKDGQRSVIKSNEMAWNLSTFDTGGEVSVPGGTRVFIYTERGVYRPGDEVNISVIARNEDNTFPDNHPLTMRIFNPRNQKVYDRTNTGGKDGFYHFHFQTGMEDPTGNWRAEVLAGSQTFYHTLKIETVVPFRLKVSLEPEKSTLSAADKTLNVTLSSTYLFGNPAAGLNAEINLTLRKKNKTFKQYKNFTFSNETMDYKTVEAQLFKGTLNSDGKAQISWRLPSFKGTPSALEAVLEARVLEKGGRPNLNSLVLPVDPYPYYAGLQRPDFDYGYAKVGMALRLPYIVVDPQGKAAAGRPLKYRIYKGKHYWWWEYNERDNFKLRYKSHYTTSLIREGTLVSQAIPENLEFTPDEDGTYLVEVEDAGGHTAGMFIRAYAWGYAGGGTDAGTLTLKSDKEKYFIGEEAVVSFPVPQEGSILVSIEKGKQVLSSRWYSHNPNETEVKIPIPITTEMAPTTYVSVSIIQPHAQSANDRPIRMYGVVPLNVEDPSTRQEIIIDMANELRSGEKFTVNIKTADMSPTRFTIAVVDEGLLDLTRFQTPDPWKHFFKKLRLGVESYDLFAYVIGANKGDVFRTFSIGGGIAESYRESQLDTGKKKRFKPVSMFKGPLKTDANGRAKVEFEMPEYVGSVRVMVVAAKQKRYARAEKAVPVKTELMVLPSLPRVLGPQDVFSVPVTVFAMKENIGRVDVTMTLEGPIMLEDSSKKQISFDKTGDKDVFFKVKADAAIGQAKITIRAASAKYSAQQVTDIEVRPSSPRIYDSEDKTVESGQSGSFIIPGRGIPGSNNARISIRSRPNLNFTHRLLWLIRFPYGCIEQNTSAVFPQLYLKKFLRDTRAAGKELKQERKEQAEKDIDANINAAIARLRKFQLPSGGFTYWPGNTTVTEWGTNYAGHFLIEAKKLGYNVPDDLYNNWLRYQGTRATSSLPQRPGATRDQSTDLEQRFERLLREYLMNQTYRVYLMALAGKPAMGAMNFMKQNSLKDMRNTEKWMFASAYKFSGVERTAEQIARDAGLEVPEYREFGGTYGSTLRDKAIILEMLVNLERWAEADRLANELSQVLSKRNWYSTQTTAYMLLSVGKYLQELEGKSEEKPHLKGVITLPDGQKVEFDTEEIGFEMELPAGFGKEITLSLDKSYNAKRAFATLSWNGVPLKSDVQDIEKNIRLQVEWLDDDGMRISPAELAQGTTFWGHFTVRNLSSVFIEETALVQVLPAGWEIENIRLSGEDLSGWMKRWKLNREEYLDIRDDRIMWFFDLRPSYENSRGRNEMDFVVKLNAVSVGEFFMPPTIAEAMYNTDYQARKAWEKIVVKAK